LITFTDSSPVGTDLVVVIEVRDRQSPAGRKAISDTMETAMAERGASAGIYLSRTPAGLAAEIGGWAEGDVDRGSWVATTDSSLLMAIRFLVVQERLQAKKEAAEQVDVDVVRAQLRRIRTSLDRVRNINRHVTAGTSSFSTIRGEAEALRDDVMSSIRAIEEAIGLLPPEEEQESRDEAA
jgi:hypothetical protein